MGRELGHALPAQQLFRLGPGHVGQKDLALGRTVDGQPRPGVRHDAQSVPRLHLIQRDDAAALADGQHHRCAGGLGQVLHVGAGHQ